MNTALTKIEANQFDDVDDTELSPVVMPDSKKHQKKTGKDRNITATGTRRSINCSVGRLVVRSVGWLLARSVVRVCSCPFAPSIGRSNYVKNLRNRTVKKL